MLSMMECGFLLAGDGGTRPVLLKMMRKEKEEEEKKKKEKTVLDHTERVQITYRSQDNCQQ